MYPRSGFWYRRSFFCTLVPVFWTVVPLFCALVPVFLGCRKRGLSLRGSLHGGFDGLGGSGEHLALFLLVLQNTARKDNRDGFDGLGGFDGCGGFGRDGYPP